MQMYMQQPLHYSPRTPRMASPSRSPGQWKHYLPEPSPISLQPTLQLIEQKQRKKQQMLRRACEIQKRVMPILRGSREEQTDEDIGWWNKMEQRISKIQTRVNSMQQNVQIKAQKRLMEVEQEWLGKIQKLIRSNGIGLGVGVGAMRGKQINNQEKNEYVYQKGRVIQQQRQRQRQEFRQRSMQEQNDENYEKYNEDSLEEQSQNENSEKQGYFTRRENEQRNQI